MASLLSQVDDTELTSPMGGDMGCGAVRDGVDLGMNFDDLEFSQEGGGSLLGVGAVGSVYRAIHKVSASLLLDGPDAARDAPSVTVFGL